MEDFFLVFSEKNKLNIKLKSVKISVESEGMSGRLI